MNSNYRHLILLLILYITTLISYGCGGTFQSTPSPTKFVATQTPAPKPTVTKTSTPDDVATVQPTVLANYPSPDGKWRVDIIRHDCINYSYPDYMGIIAYEQLKIVNLNNGTEKIVEDQLLNCDGVGAFGFDGLYWSPSNRYFYYSDWREGSPDGGCGNYFALPIYRLDTVTQEIITIGGSHISPDQTKLAFWRKNEIVIWDLDQGEVARVRGLASNIFNGEIAWSPDGQSLVYLQSTFDCAPDYGTTYVTRLDLAKMSQTLLLKFQPPGFGGVSWDGPELITLIDGEGKLWTYDLITKETLLLGIAALTPTPVPLGVFALVIYPPLIMNYDTSVWKDVSHYKDASFKPAYSILNYLQSLSLGTCQLGVQGPTGDLPTTSQAVQLGSVRYEVITFADSVAESTTTYYIENKSITGFNYEMGTSVFIVHASLSDWDRCKVLAEKVLSTLRVP